MSGGKDSCVLLDLIAEFSRSNNEKQIYVLHFDHGIQEQSKQWSVFCEKLCQKYGFDFISIRSEVEVDTSIGLEASARNSRYLWFRDVMQQKLNKDQSLQHAVLITAHHSDDQAETILMNILRGTGIKGLRGIAEKKQIFGNGQDTHNVIRPLLSFSQDQIDDYAQEKKLEWCEDPSNQDTGFRRNAIRHLVLPELKKIRPDTVSQFQKLSQRAADAHNLLNDIAISDLALTDNFDWFLLDESYALSLEGIRGLSIARQLNAIKTWLDLIQFPAESETDLLQVLDWSINGANSGAEIRRGQRIYRYFQNVFYVMPLSQSNPDLLFKETLLWPDTRTPFLFDYSGAQQEKWKICCHESSDYFAKSVKLYPSTHINEILLPGGSGHIKAKQSYQQEKVPTWRRIRSLFVTNEAGEFIGIIGGQKLQDFYFDKA